MIRIDALWLAVEPVDMRAGADRLLARVVQVFGASRAHHAYVFSNARSTRIKLLVHAELHSADNRGLLEKCPRSPVTSSLC